MESNFSIFTQDDIHKVEGGNINSDYSFIEGSESEAEDINANEPALNTVISNCAIAFP